MSDVEMVVGMLPAVVWLIACGIAIWICGICIWRSRRDATHVVRPVSWPVVGGHLASLVLAMAPYVIMLLVEPRIDRRLLDLYRRVGWWSAAVLIVLIVSELILMYRQARRAMMAQTNAVGTRTNEDENAR